jgi:Flp pilus assembly protein TadG
LETELLLSERGNANLKDMCLQKEIRRGAFGRLRLRLRSDARGTELLEFALVLPILVMILIGIVWVGRLISVYQALGRAARDGAQVYLASTCASCGDTQPSQASATAAITAAMTAASLDPTQMPQPPQFTQNQPIDPNDPSNYQVNGVTVKVQYPVQLNVPFTPLGATTWTVTSTVTMRQEY